MATINRDFVVSLDFDENGVLYGSDNGTDTLITINPTTGAATTVGTYANSNGHSAIAFVSTGPVTPSTTSTDGFETGNFSSQPWTFSGNASWTVTNSTSNTGTFNARSGVISHSQSSGLVLTKTTAAGSVSFAKRVSSEGSFDFLRFYIDGVPQDLWSGIESGFTTVSFPVSAGSHTFEWRYTKDGSVSSPHAIGRVGTEMERKPHQEVISCRMPDMNERRIRLTPAFQS